MGTGQRLPRPLRTLDKGRHEVRTWGQARGSADSRDHSPPRRAGWAHGCTCPSFLPPRHGGWRRPLLPLGNERLCRRHSPAVASPPTQGWPCPAGSVGCAVLLECVRAVCSPQRPVKPGRLGPRPGATGRPRRAVFPKTDTCCWFRLPPAGRQLGQQLGGAGQPGGLAACPSPVRPRPSCLFPTPASVPFILSPVPETTAPLLALGQARQASCGHRGLTLSTQRAGPEPAQPRAPSP